MNPHLKFSSFQSAITYHPSCPVCFGRLQLSNQIENIFEYGINPVNKITFRFGEDILTIDTKTESITVKITQTQSYQPVYSMGCSVPYFHPGIVNTYIPTSGIFIQGLNMDCVTCCQFAYTIQMIIDMNEVRLAGLYLNSETITIESEGIVHEIRNAYSLDKTEYTSFSKDGGRKTTSIPLIPLDLCNPKDTVDRIRKLILFS